MGIDFFGKTDCGDTENRSELESVNSEKKLERHKILAQIELRRRFAESQKLNSQEPVTSSTGDRTRFHQALAEHRRAEELEAKLRVSEHAARESQRENRQLAALVSQLKSQTASFSKRIGRAEQHHALLKQELDASRAELDRLKAIPGIDQLQRAVEALLDESPKSRTRDVADAARNHIAHATQEVDTIRQKLQLATLAALGKMESTSVMFGHGVQFSESADRAIRVMINNRSITDPHA